MNSLSETDGSNGVRQGSKIIPSGTGRVDDVLDAVEDGIGLLVGAQELPDILNSGAQDGRKIRLTLRGSFSLPVVLSIRHPAGRATGTGNGQAFPA